MARPKPWLIHFFQRDAADDPERAVPAITFLDNVPTGVRSEIDAVLEAVAEAPPHSFPAAASGKSCTTTWPGFYEVRVKGADKKNHRLFCVLERDADDFGGSSIVEHLPLDTHDRQREHPTYERICPDEVRARLRAQGYRLASDAA